MAYEREVPVRYRMFWLAFTDLPRLLGEAPGLTVGSPIESPADAAEGDAAYGRLRLRVGSTTITYEGSARVARASSETCVLELAVSGKQVRGTGTAHGTLRFELHRAGSAAHPRQHVGDATRVIIKPDIRFTGRAGSLPAQTLRAAAARFADEWLDRLVEQFQRPAPDRGAAVNGERPALTSFHGDLAVRFRPPHDASRQSSSRGPVTRHPSANGTPVDDGAPIEAADGTTAAAATATVESRQLVTTENAVPATTRPTGAQHVDAQGGGTGEIDAEQSDPPTDADTAATDGPGQPPVRQVPRGRTCDEADRPLAEPDLWPLGGPARPPLLAIFGGAVALFAFLGVLTIRRLRRSRG